MCKLEGAAQCGNKSGQGAGTEFWSQICHSLVGLHLSAYEPKEWGFKISNRCFLRRSEKGAHPARVTQGVSLRAQPSFLAW